MEMTDRISVLIFALIVMAVGVYIVMSGYVVGPLARLKRAERWIVVACLVGVGGVIVFAASELLLRVVF
jgi:hypothetical protein